MLIFPLLLQFPPNFFSDKQRVLQECVGGELRRAICLHVRISAIFIIIYCYYYYYRYSALGPVWAETRAQSGDWYRSGTLHPGQVLKGWLPLLSPAATFSRLKKIYIMGQKNLLKDPKLIFRN